MCTGLLFKAWLRCLLLKGLAGHQRPAGSWRRPTGDARGCLLNENQEKQLASTAPDRASGGAPQGSGIKGLPPWERPRERLVALGASALSDRDLLAIVLRTGSAGTSALVLAERLLETFGSLRGLLEASVEEMARVRGIGMAKAAQVKAALELGRRLTARTRGFRPSVSSPQEAAELVMEDLRYLDRETFQAILLDTKHRVLGVQLVSVGHLNGAPAHPRELFKDAIRRSAAALVLVHNHPSGDPQPSPEDIALTRRLTKAGELLGIKVLDHIIVGEGCYVSLREQGLM